MKKLFMDQVPDLSDRTPIRALLCGFYVLLLITGAALAADFPSALPVELYLKTTWLPGPSTIEYRITADGVVTKTKETTTSTRSNRIVEQRLITREAWQTFTTEILPLRIKTWKRTYRRPRDGTFAFDGSFWEMRLRADDAHARSGGQNAGPNPSNPNQTIFPEGANTSGDLLLGEALEKLWISSKKSR
jgi:hypothetical protein